uniref:Uncharacterized protein n=1 Tax=Rousettus aegyptiacus TaxID=9407 RepID=A0A7J8CHA8_ROUAE|nr:hypothetical protein HJG63_007209 [Rousettus aegyptiacus]
MVLDSGAQVYEQAPPSPPASPSSLGHRLKPSDQDGTPMYPWPRSLALPLALSVSSALQPQPELQSFSELRLGQRGHMRRSESTCTINGTGRRGSSTQGRALPRQGRNPGGGTLRSAASLPHIAKTRKDIGRGSSRSPCMLVALRPTNMDHERDKFFQSHYTYNPQFEYQEPMPMAVLEKYCEASGQFIHQAVGIIEAVLEKFGTYERFEAATGGQLLTKCQIWSIVRKYMQKEGCVGEAPTTCGVSTTHGSPGTMPRAGYSMGCGRQTPLRRAWPACTACCSESSPSCGVQHCSTTRSTVPRTCPSASSSRTWRATCRTLTCAGSTACVPSVVRWTPRCPAASARTRCIWTALCAFCGTARPSIFRC